MYTEPAMAVKGLISDHFIKDFEHFIGHPLPNGLVVNGVLGWLHAASDSMDMNTYVKIMKQSFTDIEIDDAKKLLVEIVLRNRSQENVKNDKDLEKWIKGRNQPDKKEKQIDDIINIFARVDGYGMQPEFLMTSGFVKRAPELIDPEDNVENVSHKVKMLEAVVVNLANKLGEETRILKEDSKAIRSEIKNLKPSYADLFKNRETDPGNNRVIENNRLENRTAAARGSKRSRIDDYQTPLRLEKSETKYLKKDL